MPTRQFTFDTPEPTPYDTHCGWCLAKAGHPCATPRGNLQQNPHTPRLKRHANTMRRWRAATGH